VKELQRIITGMFSQLRCRTPAERSQPKSFAITLRMLPGAVHRPPGSVPHPCHVSDAQLASILELKKFACCSRSCIHMGRGCLFAVAHVATVIEAAPSGGCRLLIATASGILPHAQVILVLVSPGTGFHSGGARKIHKDTTNFLNEVAVHNNLSSN
jgi:hypothetical protein